MNKNLLLFGSEGTLGSALRTRLESQFESCLFYDRSPTTARTAECDFSSINACRATAENLIDRINGSVTVLLASGLYDGSKAMDGYSILDSLTVNLIGPVLLLNSLAEAAVENNNRARFVIVASSAARVGSRDIGYGTAKAGLEGFVRSISKSYAQRGVTAIGVNPGIFSSKMSAGQSHERQATAVSSTHLKRAADITEVADVCVYAALSAPDCLTGTFISPNGGEVNT